jgi:hypothetical protein
MEEENLSAFAEIWSEALLSADLSPEERRECERKLTSWKQTMIGGSVLEMPLTAVRQGWDYPPLVAAMQGNFDERGAWEGEAPDFADDLAQSVCASSKRAAATKKPSILPKPKDKFSPICNF